MVKKTKKFTHHLIKKLLRLQEFFVKKVNANIGSVMPGSAYANEKISHEPNSRVSNPKPYYMLLR
ncbi:MAG TPA: hypothetical protein VFL47_03685, partial [Flavisolibacter sp.]|nr:hypothetical protein [Flavisolibacter sp.]